ncbi:MAG: hypothetical protein V4539_08835 [Bacteroidota bacterium]
MQTVNNQAQLNKQLQEFTGTEQYYRHLTGYLFTDGVHFLAQEYGTFWLIDEILIANQPPLDEEFQVWKLQRVFNTDTFKLICEDGNKNCVYTKEIPFSDFSADKVELWFANNVLYLPSEH